MLTKRPLFISLSLYLSLSRYLSLSYFIHILYTVEILQFLFNNLIETLIRVYMYILGGGEWGWRWKRDFQWSQVIKNDIKIRNIKGLKQQNI